MTRTERTARLLASELSGNGEADWIDYIGLAEQVGRRLDSDFRQLFERGGIAGEDCAGQRGKPGDMRTGT